MSASLYSSKFHDCPVLSCSKLTWWTNKSSPPESGVMKPKPFVELNLKWSSTSKAAGRLAGAAAIDVVHFELKACCERMQRRDSNEI